MELVELALVNFKRFKDAKFKFSPGLNCIWGVNESGKSTIQEAILCALYGRERGKVVENWNGGPCSVDLTYRSDAEVYRVERRFTEGIVRLGRTSGGELSDVVSDKEDVARILAAHVGISSRPVFESTVFVRQMHVSSPKTADLAAVGGEIQRILTGTANISAAEVQRRLEDKRDDVKGRPRPTNPREYDATTSRLAELAEDLADARRSRVRIRDLDEELTQLEARTERDSARLKTVEELLERHGHWSELNTRHGELSSLHAGVFAACRKIRETLGDLKSVQNELADCADLVGKDVEIADHLTKLDSGRSEFESRISALTTHSTKAHPASRFTAWVLAACILLLALAGFVLGTRISPRWFWLLAPAAVLVVLLAVKRPPSNESGQVSELVADAQDKLKQLEVEGESVLNFINCRDSDQAWARIESYRALITRAHELELTLSAVLSGRTAQDWEEQEISLARQLSTATRELEHEFPGYAPTTEEADSWRTECRTLQHQLPSAQARMHEVRGALESEKRIARDLAALEGEIEFLHLRKQELEFLYRAYDEAIAAIAMIVDAVSAEYLPDLSEKAAGYLRRITSGRYAAIDIQQDWEIRVDGAEKTKVSPSALSAGTIDQLYLSLRIACGELLSNGQRLPIILDDPFASFDRNRIDNALDLILKLAEENQVLLLTHDPEILEWAKSLDSRSSCVVHELARP